MEEGEVTSCGESKNGWVRLGWIGTGRSDKIAGPICRHVIPVLGGKLPDQYLINNCPKLFVTVHVFTNSN